VEHGNRTMDWNTGGGLAAIVLWSSTIALARSMSEQLGPLLAGACVYLTGGFFCLIFLFRKESPKRLFALPRRYTVGCGFLFVLYTVLLYLAVGLASDHQQTLEIGLVNYLWPAATILLSLVLLNKRAGGLLVPGTVLALAGEFLVITQATPVSWGSFWDHLRANPNAYAFALIAALSWGLYSTLTRRWSPPGSGGAVALFIPAAGLVLLVLRLFSAETFAWDARALGEAVVLAAVTVLAYALWDKAMRMGNLLLVAACSYFTPLLSTIVSCVYLQVTPGKRLWIGCLALMAGSLMTWLSVSDRRPR
jgi:drug/metabolite transporter (DMT)-like permease